MHPLVTSPTHSPNSTNSFFSSHLPLASPSPHTPPTSHSLRPPPHRRYPYCPLPTLSCPFLLLTLALLLNLILLLPPSNPPSLHPSPRRLPFHLTQPSTYLYALNFFVLLHLPSSPITPHPTINLFYPLCIIVSPHAPPLHPPVVVPPLSYPPP